MKITSKRANAIRQRYEELVSLAQQYLREKKPNGWYYPTIRFTDSGDIETYVNTACHCHPEMEWVDAANAEEFGEWLDKRITY